MFASRLAVAKSVKSEIEIAIRFVVTPAIREANAPTANIGTKPLRIIAPTSCHAQRATWATFTPGCGGAAGPRPARSDRARTVRVRSRRVRARARRHRPLRPHQNAL